MTLGENVAKAKGIITDSITAAKAKGATFPPGATPEYLPTAIEAIPSGGGLELQDIILDGSATEIYTEAEALMNYALYQRTALSAFAGPSVSTIGSYALNGCTSLASLDLPVCTSIGAQSLRSCTSLASLDLPVCTSIGAASLYGCSSLTTLILRSPTVAALSNISALDNTPIASGTGYIYVPAALVESYKTATNWVTYASQIRAIEDYPEVHHD